MKVNVVNGQNNSQGWWNSKRTIDNSIKLTKKKKKGSEKSLLVLFFLYIHYPFPFFFLCSFFFPLLIWVNWCSDLEPSYLNNLIRLLFSFREDFYLSKRKRKEKKEGFFSFSIFCDSGINTSHSSEPGSGIKDSPSLKISDITFPLIIGLNWSGRVLLLAIKVV